MSSHQRSFDHEPERLAQGSTPVDEIDQGTTAPTGTPAKSENSSYRQTRWEETQHLIVEQSFDSFNLFLRIFFSAIKTFLIIGGSAVVGTLVFEIGEQLLEQSEYVTILKTAGQIMSIVFYLIWLIISQKDDVALLLGISKPPTTRKQ